MPRPVSTKSNNPILKSATCAQGQDDSWKQQALCLGKSNNPNSPFYEAWYTDPWRVHTLHDGTKISGATLTEVALQFCAMCPVQWDCATWAINVEEPYCVWGASHEDIEWLQRKRSTRAAGDIERARREGTAVQVMVRKLKLAI